MNLFPETSPFLVIEYPTGVKVGGQVGGLCCMQPRVQGFALPLATEPWTVALGEIYHQHGHCGAGKQASFAMIPYLLKAWPAQQERPWRLELDVARAADGTEAWYPVRVRAQDMSNPTARWLDAAAAGCSCRTTAIE